MLNELIDKRFSPYSFVNKNISDDILNELFDAARKAPSSYNEQPWRFIIGKRNDEGTYNKIVNTLMDGNKEWAKEAPVLILTVTSNTFSRNDKTNYHAEYDLGQAVAFLILKATELDIYSHQMAGFSRDKAIEHFKIPQEYTPSTVIALGYKKPEDVKPEKKRMAISELVFKDYFGN